MYVKNHQLQDKTVDSYHKEYMDILNQNNNKKIPELMKLKDNLKEQYEKSSSLDEKLQIKDKIAETKEKIKKMKKFEKDYLLNNSKFVYNYFEEKKEISQGNNNVTVIDKFFGKEHNTQVSSLKEKNISKQYFQSLSNMNLILKIILKKKRNVNIVIMVK